MKSKIKKISPIESIIKDWVYLKTGHELSNETIVRMAKDIMNSKKTSG